MAINFPTFPNDRPDVPVGEYNAGPTNKTATALQVVTSQVNASTLLDYAEVNVAVFI